MMTDIIPRSVLVVDDQLSIAQATETMLLEIGVTDVAIASSVFEALREIDEISVDLAILDYELGVNTGWLVAERLCQAGIRMIITTGREGIVLPAACGSAAVLKRPYNLNVLARLASQRV